MTNCAGFLLRDGSGEHDRGDVVLVKVDDLVGDEGEERGDDDGWMRKEGGRSVLAEGAAD